MYPIPPREEETHHWPKISGRDVEWVTFKCRDDLLLFTKSLLFLFFFWLYYLARGILGLQPGIEPGAWRWEHWALTTGQPGKSLDHYLNYTIKICIKYAETPRVPPP